MLLFAMQICELVPAAELRWVEAVWKRRVDECTTNPAALKRRGLEDECLCGIGTFSTDSCFKTEVNWWLRLVVSYDSWFPIPKKQSEEEKLLVERLKHHVEIGSLLAVNSINLGMSSSQPADAQIQGICLEKGSPTFFSPIRHWLLFISLS